MAIATGTALLAAGALGAGASIYSGMQGAKAAERAADKQSAAANYAANLQQQQFEQTREDQLPWIKAGTRALGTLEEMMAERPSVEDFEMSDYAKFMQGEGLKAIEAKSRAGGYYNTGATSREMLDYAQDVAGGEYQNYLNQYYQSLNPYLSLAGAGQQQVTTLGQMGAQSAAQQGAYATQAANAQAQGIYGKYDAYGGMMQNLAGLGMGGLMYASQPSAPQSFQVPAGWASQSTGTGFASAWEV